MKMNMYEQGEKKWKDGGVRQKAMTQKMREVGKDYTEVILCLWSNLEWVMHDTNSPRDLTPNMIPYGSMYEFMIL